MARNRIGSARTTPTLHQVARVAGVSIATASRVITGAVPVSPDRRARVEDAVALLGYVPDERARDLRRNVQKTVGLIVPDLGSPLHGGVFRALHRSLQEDGSTLLAFESDAARDVERAAVEVLVRSHARAIVVATSAGLPVDVLMVLRRRGIRVVFFNDRPLDPAATCVCLDDRGGARTLTEHLIGLGHRRIGLLSGPLDGSTGIDRRAGFLEAVERAGLSTDEALVRGFAWSLEAGERATRELLALPLAPTAILAADPVLAAGALSELRGQGLRVPRDVSLASFYRSDHIRFVDPPITSFVGVERAVAAAIVATLEAEVPGGRVEVALTPAFRASTGVPSPTALRT